MAGSDVGADVWVSEYVSPHDVYMHGVTEILAASNTEWQSMQIVQSGVLGRALVLDGKWQSCTGDEHLYHEPLVQPACVALALAGQAPKTALILGGGEGATLREVLRWSSIERAAMVDIDGEVVEACKKHLHEMHRGCFDDPRADVVIGDALRYIDDPANAPDGGWDLVISDLSDPIEDGPSFMLFTKEYFADIKKVMRPGGALVVQSGPVSPSEMFRHARLSRTLRDVFGKTMSLTSHIAGYVNPWSFIIATDGDLEPPVDASKVDAVLARSLREIGSDDVGLRCVDGPAMAGLFGLTKELRLAIEGETEVYTKERPPTFFGKGAAGSERAV